MKSITTVIFVLFCSGFSYAAPTSASCAELKSELKAMQKAQQQVVNSLVNNHESFASSLEEYSLVIKSNRASSSAFLVSSQMDQSAEAFRARGFQGKRMAIKLSTATADLLARVAACL